MKVLITGAAGAGAGVLVVGRLFPHREDRRLERQWRRG